MNITIDGKLCEANYGEFILDIAKRNNIHIPTLCHSDALPGQANCRLCIVEIVENGSCKIVTSCVYPVTKKIDVFTHSPKIIDMRRTILMLLAARVPENETLKKLKAEYAVSDQVRFISNSSEECILCGLCVRACDEIGLSAISTVNRGITKKVSTPYDEPAQTCIGCGSCAQVCPTGAIKVSDTGNKRIIWNKQFELLACNNCHTYYITKEQHDYLNSKLECENEQLCDKCKKLAVTRNFKDIYGIVS